MCARAGRELSSGAIGERRYRGFLWLFLLRFLCDGLRGLSRLKLASTPGKHYEHENETNATVHSHCSTSFNSGFFKRNSLSLADDRSS